MFDLNARSLAVVMACCLPLSAAFAQPITPPGVSLAATYDNATLAIPGPLGGITFSADGTVLYMGASANSALGEIYSYTVQRDLITNRITALGTPTLFTAASNIDGGLDFGPAGTLFWTTYTNHQLGQRTTSGLTMDFPLAPTGVPASTGALQFTPQGFPGAGDCLVASYDQGSLFRITLTSNGDGTFTPDANSATLFATIPFGTEGFRHIPSGPNAGSIALVNFSIGNISLLRVDPATGQAVLLPSGDTDLSPFITGIAGAEGLAFDPVTNDFFVSTFGGGNQLFQFTGFPEVAPITGPSTYSVSSGATIDFPIDLGATFAGTPYLVVCGGTGTSPGTPAGSVTIPINFDALTYAALDLVQMNAPHLPGWTGTLDAQGRALARFVPGQPLGPQWAGLTVSLSVLATPPDFASPSIDVAFIP